MGKWSDIEALYRNVHAPTLPASGLPRSFKLSREAAASHAARKEGDGGGEARKWVRIACWRHKNTRRAVFVCVSSTFFFHLLLNSDLEVICTGCPGTELGSATECKQRDTQLQVCATSKGKSAINDMDAGPIYPYVLWRVTFSVIDSLFEDLNGLIHYFPHLNTSPCLISRLLINDQSSEGTGSCFLKKIGGIESDRHNQTSLHSLKKSSYFAGDANRTATHLV